MWICAHGCSTDRDQKRVLIPLQLELQEVVSQQIGVLGTEFRSPARAVHALNRQSMSLAPKSVLLKLFSLRCFTTWKPNRLLIPTYKLKNRKTWLVTAGKVGLAFPPRCTKAVPAVWLSSHFTGLCSHFNATDITRGVKSDDPTSS